MRLVILHLDVDMKHRAYCCDASRDLYEQYYSRQNGVEIPVFACRRFQRGHGLGNILGVSFGASSFLSSKHTEKVCWQVR